MKSNNRKFLIVTDNTFFETGMIRSIGAYRVADELEKAGIETVVLDHFYSFPDVLEFIQNLLDETFIGVGFSTTFLTPPIFWNKAGRHSSRNKQNDLYYDLAIINPDNNERKEWFKRLKEIINAKSPEAKIFIGGGKANYFYHEMYSNLDEVDYVVMGSVDLIFPKAIKDLELNKNPKFINMGNKKILDTINEYKQAKDCPKHNWRDHWFIQKNEALPIEIGRGCAFNCKFCNYDKKERYLKSSSDLKDEFIENYEKFGTQYYHFLDDCFNDHRVKVEEVCNLILSLPFKIEWVSYARFDVAVRFPYTADLMVESGGSGFYWGVESLTENVARKAGKGTSPDKIKDFILNFSQKHKGKAYNACSLIVGLPGETESSWISQIEWLCSTQNFDFCFSGPLNIMAYNKVFDGAIIDYADYVRNPTKYGFTEVDTNRSYWKHQTMDRTKAEQLNEWTMNKIREKFSSRKGIKSGIWIYPALRSLGFTRSEIEDIYFNTDPIIQEKLRMQLYSRLELRNNKYINEIKGLV